MWCVLLHSGCLPILKPFAVSELGRQHTHLSRQAFDASCIIVSLVPFWTRLYQGEWLFFNAANSSLGGSSCKSAVL